MSLAWFGWFAAAHAGPRDLTAGLVEPLIDAGALHRVVIGTIADGRREIWTFGAGADPRGAFELGEASGAFAGVLLADAVARGEVDPDAALGDLLPGAGAAGAVPVIDLAAGTGGLPRWPAGFRPADPLDPYAGSTPDGLLAGLAGTPLADAPGGSWSPSPLGVAALGLGLQRATGRAWPSLVEERLPGLGRVGVDLPVVPGHDADLRPVDAWSTGAWAPAVGLRADADALLRLLAACLDPGAPLGPALATATARQRPLGPDGAVGLGWHTAPDGTVWTHGHTAGHHALIAFHPEQRVGVALLADTASELADRVGFAALAALAGQTPPAIPVRREVPADPSAWDALVGSYGEAVVRRDGDRLVLALPGQPPRALHALGPRTFFLRSPDAEVRFDGRSLVLVREGRPPEEWRRR